MKNRKHLSFWGVGPAYVTICAALTAAGIIVWKLDWLAFGDVSAWSVPMAVIGALLLLAAAVLYGQVLFRTKLFDHIRQNHLVTTGVYAWVRNPIYSAVMMACTGVLLLAHNLLLLVLPLVFWALMTFMLVHTEERWLRDLYGQEYVAYCARVNRCIPCPPRRS